MTREMRSCCGWEGLYRLFQGEGMRDGGEVGGWTYLLWTGVRWLCVGGYLIIIIAIKISNIK
jgi:hypothetical protein